MKKTIGRIFATVLFPFHEVAKIISTLLKIEGYEDIPTTKEWFGIGEIFEEVDE